MPNVDQPWWERYRDILRCSDLVVLLWSVGSVPVLAGTAGRLAPGRQVLCSIVVALAWYGCLGVAGSRGRHVLGAGCREFTSILVVTAHLVGLVAVLAYLDRDDRVRGYLLVAVPIGTTALLVTRWGWRLWLRALRRTGDWCSRVLLVGDESRVTLVAERLTRSPASGYTVVGTYQAARTGADQQRIRSILRTARRLSVSTIAVTAGDALGPVALRQLGWLLEGTGIQLAVVPGLTSTAGGRLANQPVDGLPLLCVTEPCFTGAGRLAKRALDVVGSLLTGLLLAPLLLAVAVAVVLDSGRPVFYRQWRIGRHGKPFRIWKFRTMTADADRRRDELATRNHCGGPLFKVRDDPRVTTVGRLLRRCSLDELPQLWNVLVGHMSLVGPRPPLRDEMLRYAKETRRRLLVRPGMTGLWQVSGRADLTWQEGIELDLYYVDNWSFAGDLVILGRTARAVIGGHGAY